MKARMTLADLQDWAQRAGLFGEGLKDTNMRAVIDELIDRKKTDPELARLANILRGYYNRHKMYPISATTDLLDRIDKLLEDTDAR